MKLLWSPVRELYGSSVKLYLSVSDPELVTESIPANTESDDNLAMEDRPRRINRPPSPLAPEDSRILFYGRIMFKSLTELAFVDFD